MKPTVRLIKETERERQATAVFLQFCGLADYVLSLFIVATDFLIYGSTFRFYIRRCSLKMLFVYLFLPID